MMATMAPHTVYSDEDALVGSFKQLQTTIFFRRMLASHIQQVASLRLKLLDSYPGKLLSIVVMGPHCVPPTPQVREVAMAAFGDPVTRDIGTAVVVLGESQHAASLRSMLATMLLAARSNHRPVKLFAELAPAGDYLAAHSEGTLTAQDVNAAVEFLSRLHSKSASP